MILYIVAEQRDGNFFGMTEEESNEYYNNLTPEAANSGHYWYLHGELQSDIGFDKGLIENILPNQFIDRHSIKLQGVFACKIKNINRPCIGYFWTVNYGYGGRTKGLVCYLDNKEDREYCREKYLERAYVL